MRGSLSDQGHQDGRGLSCGGWGVLHRMRCLCQLLPDRGYEDGGKREESYSAENLQRVNDPLDERKRKTLNIQISSTNHQINSNIQYPNFNIFWSLGFI